MRLIEFRTAVTVVALIFCAATIAGAQTSRNTFSNSAPNAIPTLGPAATYPSTIPVSGLTGYTYHVSLRMNISHTFPRDLDILLVSPLGKAVMVMSDVGGGFDMVDARLDIDDCAPRFMANSNNGQFIDGGNGRYRPTNTTNVGGADAMPAPAPAGPYDNSLAEFNFLTGTAINGNWSLYVYDDQSPDGQFHSWSLTFYTQPTPATQVGGRNPVSCTAPDYDGDGRTDVAIFRPASGEWFIAQSGQNNLVTIVGWGAPSSTGADDTEVPADYDGDGITDVAVYRQSTGTWFVRKSSFPSIMQVDFGAPSSSGLGDSPVPGDYDGDGQADIAIYRLNTGEWFLRPSSGQPVTSFLFGYPPTGDRPARR